VWAKSYAQRQIEQRAQVYAGSGSSAKASIHSFPFVGRLLLSGSAGDLDLRVFHVVSQAVTLSTVRVQLTDVHVDKGKLLGQRKVELTSIRKGVVTVGLDAAELSHRVGFPVTVSSGKVTVDVRGQVFTAVPTVVNGNLRLQVGSLPAVTVAIPRTDLIACQATTVVATGGEVQLSCETNNIPPALLRAASRAVSA
jgi:hypothetical protein